MLRVRTGGAAILMVCALCAPAGAASIDMHYAGSVTDPWQAVPIGDDGLKVIDKKVLFGVLPAAIATPDGSVWGNTDNPSQPVSRSYAGATTYLPAFPSNAIPSHWARANDGILWFTEFLIKPNYSQVVSDVIGRLDPATGSVTEFAGLTPGAGPRSITAGPDGNIWFLEQGIGSIGRIAPNGAVTEFPLPAWAQPATIRGQEISAGPGGDLYFIVAGGLARISTDGVLRPEVINGGLADFAPNAVAYGRDGNLWVTECNPDSATRVSPSGSVTRTPDGTFPPGACPQGMTAGLNGTVWLYEWNAGRGGRVVFDTPLASTDDPTDIASTMADLNGEATPRGSKSTAQFEYGTTTSYGRTTPAQDVGDGDESVPVTARPTDLQPLTTYHYRLVVKSIIGTAVGVDQTVTTTAVPPPPPPPLPADDDGDGFPVTVDCDDVSAAIHPGARDKPGDRVDQDCSGGDARPPRFQPHADAGWRTLRGRIVFTRMLIDGMPAGSSLRLTCSGPGCNLRDGYRVTMAKPVRRLDVTKRLRGARLRKGAKVELVLSRPGYVTTIVRWTIGPPPRVTILCREPGAKTAKACQAVPNEG